MGVAPVGICGNGPWQPAVWVPLQVAVLMTATEAGKPPLVLMAAYRVWVWSSTDIPNGARPALIVAARCPHPEWSVPLQVAPLITAIVRPSKPFPGMNSPGADAATVPAAGRPARLK